MPSATIRTIQYKMHKRAQIVAPRCWRLNEHGMYVPALLCSSVSQAQPLGAGHKVQLAVARAARPGLHRYPQAQNLNAKALSVPNLGVEPTSIKVQGCCLPSNNGQALEGCWQHPGEKFKATSLNISAANRWQGIDLPCRQPASTHEHAVLSVPVLGGGVCF